MHQQTFLDYGAVCCNLPLALFNRILTVRSLLPFKNSCRHLAERDAILVTPP